MLFKEGFSDRVRHAALISFLASGLSVLLTSPSLAASSVTLAWNPSSGTNIAGYRIHYGGASRTYTNMVSVGSATSATVSNLSSGGTYYFAATAYDTSGIESDYSNEATNTVALPTNTPPTLNALGNLAINEDAGAQSVNLSGISSGSASENQTLTVTATSSNTGLVPNPTVIYTSPNTTGSLSFTPVANAFGTATITVTVNDGGANNNTITQTFTVTVNPVNDPPTLNALSNISVNENAGAQTVNLAGISSGAANESQTLTVTASSSNTGVVPNPMVTYTSPNTTGSLSFTPVANVSGTATITVTVNDGGASNNIVTRTFTVTVSPVNQPPTLNALGNVTVNENTGAQSVSLAGISSGAANESQTLTVTASSSNTGVVPNPMVTYTSPNTTGSLSFTPVANVSGTATITVTVNDGGASNNIVTRTFTVTVSPVNQPPTLNAINNISVNENASAQSVSLAGISSGAANESQTLTVTASSSNTGVVPNPTVTYTSPNTTGSLSFTPVANASGSATVTVTVNDGGSSNNIVTRTFTVTVNPVNQPPTLNALSNLSVNENAGQQTVNLAGISSGAANESQTLMVTATSSNTGLIPNPTVNYTSPNTTGSISFTPVAGVSGNATITVTVNDGGASNNIVTRTFTVTVNSVNTPPTMLPINNLTINENAGQQSVTISGISSGSSNELQTLTITASSSNTGVVPNPTVNYASPNASGSLTFTPVANASGTATITVTVNDGGTSNNTTTRTFTVTVNPVNQQPALNAINNVAVNENAAQQSVSLSGISSGAANENQTLTITASSSNTGLIPNPTVNYTSPNTTGSLTFTPASMASGSATITVQVNDGGASNNIVTRTFTVTVNPVNQQPTLNAINNVAVSENAGQQSVNLSGISSGAANENQTLTVTAKSSNTSVVPNPAVTYTSPNSTGSLSFTPVANASGSATITVTVNDGGASNNIVTRSFTVTVNAVNQPPTITPIADQATPQDTATAPIPFIIGDSQTAASNLVLYAYSDNPATVPTNNIVFGGSDTNRTVTITPADGQSGQANITITVSDGIATASTTFQLSIAAGRPVNNPPTISAIPDQTVTQNSPTAPISFTIGDVETAASNLIVSATSSNLTLLPTDNIMFGGSGSNRTVTLTPVVGMVGASAVTVTVNDGTDISSTTFNFNVVAPVNQGGSNLTLTVVGAGKVTPNLATQKLTIGRSYTVTANPNPGQAFAGWSGSVTSMAQRLTFVLKSNSVLTATFVPVTVVVNGKGTIYPNPATSTSLVVGKNYSVTAMPSAGQLFVSWSGSVTSSSPKITCLMSSNVVLQANFTPNPYLAVQGTYAGLFNEKDAVRPTSAGYFTATVTSSGSYSGSVTLGTNKAGFSGKLDLNLNGNTSVKIQGESLPLQFTVGTNDLADEIFGTLSSTNWTSSLLGDREVYSTAKGHNSPLAGAYTIIFPGQDTDPTIPTGDGYGTVHISTAGIATFSGTLADGTPVNQTAPVSENGEWPLFVPLYGGQGCLMSWITFTNDTTDDLTGLVTWIKPDLSGNPSAAPTVKASPAVAFAPVTTAPKTTPTTPAFYAAGFTYDFQAAGSKFIAPANQTVHVLSVTNASAIFSGGNLAADFTNSITLGSQSKVTNQSTNKLTMTFSLTTGTFTGTVIDPSSGLSRTFGGAVFQKQNVAYGFLRGTNQTSQVYITQ